MSVEMYCYDSGGNGRTPTIRYTSTTNTSFHRIIVLHHIEMAEPAAIVRKTLALGRRLWRCLPWGVSVADEDLSLGEVKAPVSDDVTLKATRRDGHVTM